MSLVSLRELLNDSRKKRYGVFATNAFTFEMAETIIDAALEKKSPVILMIAEDLFRYLNPEIASSSILYMIKKANVPVVFHLDHGRTYELVIKCIDFGFNSLMYDGSNLPLQENIEKIKYLKKLAAPLGVSVEGEVGHVGGLDGKQDSTYTLEIDRRDFTKLEDAVEFVEKTGVDALAVAVGTIHGKFYSKPALDFERIRNINAAIEVPLVLHGSSGLTDEDFTKAIESGITKINYFTGLVDLSNDKAREIIKNDYFSYISMNRLIMETVKKEIMLKMDLFQSSGKG